MEDLALGVNWEKVEGQLKDELLEGYLNLPREKFAELGLIAIAVLSGFIAR